MKLAAILTAGLLTASIPAFAQEAGSPGATGTQGPLTGSNTNSGYARDYYNGPYGNGGYYGPGTAWGYGNGPDVYNYEDPGAIPPRTPYENPPGMIEGRAAAPDYDDDSEEYVRPAPTHHHHKHRWSDQGQRWSDQSNQW
jgi:hypothetical protein